MNTSLLEQQYKRYPKAWPQFVIGFVAIVAVIIIWNVTVSFGGFTERGWGMLALAFQGLVRPSWAVIS